MEVKIPSEIKIATHSYGIKLDPHLKGDDGDYGQVNHRTQEITIWSEAPPSMRNEILLHEVLHVAQLVYRVELTDHDMDRIAETIAELLFNNLGLSFDWSEIKEKGDCGDGGNKLQETKPKEEHPFFQNIRDAIKIIKEK